MWQYTVSDIARVTVSTHPALCSSCQYACHSALTHSFSSCQPVYQPQVQFSSSFFGLHSQRRGHRMLQRVRRLGRLPDVRRPRRGAALCRRAHVALYAVESRRAGRTAAGMPGNRRGQGGDGRCRARDTGRSAGRGTAADLRLVCHSVMTLRQGSVFFLSCYLSVSFDPRKSTRRAPTLRSQLRL
jgi:hypothetical protein